MEQTGVPKLFWPIGMRVKHKPDAWLLRSTAVNFKNNTFHRLKKKSELNHTLSLFFNECIVLGSVRMQ